MLFKRKSHTKPRTVKELTRAEAAYLAGILDGEGSIVWQFSKSRGRKVNRRTPVFHVQLYVYNTSEELMSWLRGIGGKVQVKLVSGIQVLHGQKRTCYQWLVWRHSDVHYLLRILSPFLKVKYQKAQDVLSAIDEHWGVAGVSHA